MSEAVNDFDDSVAFAIRSSRRAPNAIAHGTRMAPPPCDARDDRAVGRRAAGRRRCGDRAEAHERRSGRAAGRCVADCNVEVDRRRAFVLRAHADRRAQRARREIRERERRLHAPARAASSGRARASPGDAATSPAAAAPTSTMPAPCDVTGSPASCCAVPTSRPLSASAPEDGRACASSAAAPATVAAARARAVDRHEAWRAVGVRAGIRGCERRRPARRGRASRAPSNASPDDEKLATRSCSGVRRGATPRARRRPARPRASRASAARAAESGSRRPGPATTRPDRARLPAAPRAAVEEDGRRARCGGALRRRRRRAPVGTSAARPATRLPPCA